jgi:general secretion pathway protein L
MQATSPPRFFGLNLSTLQSDWAAALVQMGGWPMLRWLTPTYVTRINTTASESADYIEKPDRKYIKRSPVKSPRFFGCLLPESLVLWHAVVLPKLPADATQAALELEARSLSPFAPEDSVWAHTTHASGPQEATTHIVICSRRIIAQHVAALASPAVPADSFEIWVKPPQGEGFVVLDGFGEKKRRQLSAWWRVVNLCLVMLLAGIAFAAAITPTAQLRLRAIQASQDYEKLAMLAAPALEQRAQLLQLEQQIAALQGYQAQSLKPELILLRLTNLLPDETYLTRLQAQGDKFTLNGITPNTAALMQQLGAQTGVKDVRAPTAAVKQRGSDREAFSIEFTVDPSSLRP